MFNEKSIWIMKTCMLFFLYLILFAFAATGQVSHGGRPLPADAMIRSASATLFEEMPSFDIEAEKAIDESDDDLRGAYRFAYKFMTDFDRSNSGITYTLSDGTKVWRLGIRSRNAYSINILFSKYELPEGAQVFLYDPEQLQILGSFTHLNNSPLGILPVAPIYGDELIIEYREPALAPFSGKLSVGEVNHAYRSIRGAEPAMGDSYVYRCMPSPVCINNVAGLDEMSRSVVLMIIDGTILCTGVMANNAAEDGKPYLMTASHCLNKNFAVTNPDYAEVASRIVFFFNYESPTCNVPRRGPEEMSTASSYLRAVNTDYDMALLELIETPPAHYRPYYSGWTIDNKGGKAP
jgi:hypothetical protein